jgi:hypothetical protein
MNAIFPRFIKLAYRKEPISSFILIVGAVDALIGGVGERWTLLSFGILILLIGTLVRWRQMQNKQLVATESRTKYILPPSPSDTPLPILVSKTNKRSL